MGAVTAMTYAEAAEVLGCSIEAIHTSVSRGTLERIGRGLVDEASVHRADQARHRREHDQWAAAWRAVREQAEAV